MRPLLVNVNVTRGGKLLYQQVSYAGYIGCLTCVQKGAYSATVDTRFDKNLDKYLLKWLFDGNDKAQFTSLIIRMALESPSPMTFDAVIKHFTTFNYIGPSYIIVGGTKANEGAVLTIRPNDPNDPTEIWKIGDANATWYVLETNYDHNKSEPIFDDRRLPAEDCLNNHIKQTGYTKESLYNVLHAKPNRNRLTTYTALMSAAEGLLESSLQYCNDIFCPLW